MVGAWWIWLCALVLYVGFRLWYDDWRGPLTKDEIDALMTEASRTQIAEYSDPAVLRAFLEADDGREFIMSNLVRVHPGQVPHPFTGEPTEGLALMQEYGRRFVKLLFFYGGHPMHVMRKVGGYVDSWNTVPDPGWHIVGAMRYRSRRDLIRLARDPQLAQVHPFKAAGIDATFSFPTHVMASFALRPRVWVALVLALAASLIHLMSLASLLTH